MFPTFHAVVASARHTKYWFREPSDYDDEKLSTLEKAYDEKMDSIKFGTFGDVLLQPEEKVQEDEMDESEIGATTTTEEEISGNDNFDQSNTEESFEEDNTYNVGQEMEELIRFQLSRPQYYDFEEEDEGLFTS